MPPKSPVTPKKMPIVCRSDGYWIEPIDALHGERIGPYQTVKEAEEDRRSVIRFLKKQARNENPFA